MDAEKANKFSNWLSKEFDIHGMYDTSLSHEFTEVELTAIAIHLSVYQNRMENIGNKIGVKMQELFDSNQNLIDAKLKDLLGEE
jgi:hypothetical protein